MGKIIAFANQKGGVGKTTTCVNVSAYMAQMGKKVLLVDLDPQGNATSACGVDKSGELKSVFNAIVEKEPLENIILSTHVENLKILPSEIGLAGAEIELVKMNSREHILRDVLSTIKYKYDFICIDCPPSLGLLTINALSCANSVLIPIQCHFFALEGLTQLMNTIKLVKKHCNSAIFIEGVALTMRDARSNLVNQVSNEIRKFFGKKVYNTVIPNSIRLAEAPSFGEPICIYDAKSKGAVAYEELTKEILENNK